MLNRTLATDSWIFRHPIPSCRRRRAPVLAQPRRAGRHAGFRDYLHREFPEQASEWNDPKGRRQFLKLMSASLALAGVAPARSSRPKQIVPYVRQPEDIVPGRPLFFATRDAVRRDRACRFWSKATWGVRPRSRAIPIIRPASAPPTRSLRPSILDLYDPDRAQTVTDRGEVRGVERVPVSACKPALAAQKARRRRRPSFPDRDRSLRRRSPSRSTIAQPTIRRRNGISGIRSRDDGAAAPRRSATPSTTSTKPTSSSRWTLISSPCGPRRVRYAAGFRRPAPGDRRQEGHEPALRGREHADAHRREGRPPAPARPRRSKRSRARWQRRWASDSPAASALANPSADSG